MVCPALIGMDTLNKLTHVLGKHLGTNMGNLNFEGRSTLLVWKGGKSGGRAFPGLGKVLMFFRASSLRGDAVSLGTRG